jgi:hypothetical protein
MVCTMGSCIGCGAHVVGDRLEIWGILIERGKRGVIMNMIVLYYPF